MSNETKKPILSGFKKYQKWSVSVAKKDASIEKANKDKSGSHNVEDFEFEKRAKVGSVVSLSDEAVKLHNSQSHNTGFLYECVGESDAKIASDKATEEAKAAEEAQKN